MQTRNPNSNSQGIDVSRWQGNVDWQKVKNAGIKFAIIKASESTRTVDGKLTQNYEGAKSVGIPIGFYHFAHVSNDPIQEAQHYLDTVNGLEPELWDVLDVEVGSLDGYAYTKAQVSQWSRTWLETVYNATGRVPIIYTGAAFAQSYFEADLAAYKLWVAHYNTDTPMSNPVWSEWAIFQFSETGKIDGIDANVDLNEYWGDIEELLKPKEEDEDNMAMKMEQWQWDMLYKIYGDAYNQDKISWDWMQKIVDKTMTATELAFLNSVLDARIDRKLEV